MFSNRYFKRKITYIAINANIAFKVSCFFCFEKIMNISVMKSCFEGAEYPLDLPSNRMYSNEVEPIRRDTIKSENYSITSVFKP